MFVMLQWSVKIPVFYLILSLYFSSLDFSGETKYYL